MLKLKKNVCFIGLLFFLMASWHYDFFAEEVLFPQYDELTPNVNFWIKIYSLYTTSQAVVHDSIDLNIIYEVIDIKPYDAPGSRAINRKSMDKVRNKYETILRKLSSGQKSVNAAEAQKVAAMFGDKVECAAYLQAAENVRCQIGQKDRFMAGLIRSGAYIDQIREIFKANDLPEDIAYLPHVESSFNVKAYSKFGAAGMWQFTRATGRQFMEVGYALDERRDPIRATHAAARLLKENYAKLGDWPLALTAYNHGTAGMERAKKIHGNYPQIFKYYRSRIFKFASQNFYFEFLAARQIAHNYKNYFGAITLDQPKPRQTVALDGYCSFNDLRSHFGLFPETLIELNPALRPPVFAGQKLIPKGYSINLPLHANDGQTPILAQIPPWLYRTAQMPSRFYTVQSGDTTAKVAKKHEIALSDLLLANNLEQNTRIKSHQTLRIPRPGEIVAAKAPAAATPLPIMLAKAEPPLEKPVKSTKLEPPVAEKAAAPQVQPKLSRTTAPAVVDSVASASRKPKVVAGPPEEFRPNFEIVIADVRVEQLGQVQGMPMGQVQVEIEETLGHYAEWSDVPTQKIRAVNSLRFGQAVQLGRKLKIPLARRTAGEFTEQRYEFHKRLQEDFLAVYRVGQPQPYQVQAGDNIWNLCQEKFEIPMWLLKHFNPYVDLSRLAPRQTLQIPTIEKTSGDEPGIGAPDEEAIGIGVGK